MFGSQPWVHKDENLKQKRSKRTSFILKEIFKSLIKDVFASIREIKDYFETVNEADKYVKIKLNQDKIKLNFKELYYTINLLKK